MNYQLRRMRPADDVYLDRNEVDFEVIGGVVRHWIDFDGAHFFGSALLPVEEDGNSHFYRDVVRVHEDGNAEIYADPLRGLHEWLRKEKQIEKLALVWSWSDINSEPTHRLMPSDYNAVSPADLLARLDYLKPKVGQSPTLHHVELAVAMFASANVSHRYFARWDLKRLAMQYGSELDFASLETLAKSVECARKFVARPKPTNDAIHKAIKKAILESPGVPIGDDVYIQFPGMTRAGFDKALVASGFGWLPRKSNKIYKLSRRD